MRPFIHSALHFLVPALVAFRFYGDRWRFAFAVMLGAFIIDLDHLLADPIYDPNRCGVGLHPLHSYPALAVYLLLVLIPGAPRLRLVGLGLVIHVLLDGFDCIWIALERCPA